MDLEVQGEQGDQEDKPPQEDSASLAIQSPTGSPSVMEYVLTATSVDINLNGAVIKIRHPPFLQIRNKLRQLGRRRRKKEEKEES